LSFFNDREMLSMFVMPKTPSKRSTPTLLPRLRITCGEDIALGPGKAELLQYLKETGSIAEAARRIGMSYMRAWTLLKTMERCFKQPLVKTGRGGRQGGGATLTETGLKALALYEKMEAESLRVIQPAWLEMRQLLRS
jgi:molybdate transport system regulatory protein